MNAHEPDGDSPREPEPPDDPVYLRSRREAWAVFLAWVIAAVYTLSASTWLGYGLGAESVPTLAGIPTWVIWGVMLPWVAAIAFAYWFSFHFVTDDDLGEDEEGQGDG